MMKRHRQQISSSSSTVVVVTTVGLAVATWLVATHPDWIGSTRGASAFSLTDSWSTHRRTIHGIPQIRHLPLSHISSSCLYGLHKVSDSHRIMSENTGSFISSTGSLTSSSSPTSSSRLDRSYSSSSGSSSSSQLSALAVTPLSIPDMEASLSSSSSSTTMRLPYSRQLTVLDQESLQTWWTGTVLPIVSCALLITGNTVGAGCLVLPELAVGPGLLNITILYILAYLCNVISGCILADVAITQKERMTSSSISPSAALPTSLNDFATMNFESSIAGNVVASISLFVNSCVMAFDLNRFGSVLGSSNGTGGLDGNMISAIIATMIVTAMTTLSSNQLSIACSVCVTALFLSFGSVLLPGLVAVPNDVWSVFNVPGTSPDAWSAASSTFPIILMSMVFQNIIPVVVKQLHYDRTKSMTAITVGSMIPLIMYVAWCYTCLGGGVDLNVGACCSGSPLLTIFSLATLTGSSLCTGMSLAEEFNTILGTDPSSSSSSNVIPDSRSSNHQSELDSVTDTRFSLQTVVPSVAIPLVAALVFGNDNDGSGLTGALAIAGSLGSPLLYGFLPALMAWRQRQQGQDVASSSTSSQQYMIPSSTLPALGFLSTIFVGQEVLSRFNDFLSFAT